MSVISVALFLTGCTNSVIVQERERNNSLFFCALKSLGSIRHRAYNESELDNAIKGVSFYPEHTS